MTAEAGLNDIFDRQIARIVAQDLLEVLKLNARLGRSPCTTAWLAAAANLRQDVALERLGDLERHGTVVSRLTAGGTEMTWALAEGGAA